MRFLELHLKAFGHFAGEVVNFRSQPERAGGLHILAGVNEAGKSTTLEAIARLMFGFPRGEDPYGFEHPKSKLKVGAVIRRADSSELTLWRTKTRNALTVADGQSPAPDTLFEDILGSLAPATYWKLFSLNQDRLRSEGRELVEGKGDFARILFGESLGEMESFNAVRQSLLDQATSLYKPGGKIAPLNKIKFERDLHRNSLDQATTTRERWIETNDRLTKLNHLISTVENGIESRSQQAKRLERLEKTREPVNSLDAMVRAMDQFRSLPEVPYQLRDNFVRLIQVRENDTRTVEAAAEEIARQVAEIDSIRLDEDLMAEGEAIVELAREAVIAEQRRSRIEDRRAALAATMIVIQEKLRGLGFDPNDPSRIPVLEKAGKEHLERKRRQLIDSIDSIDRSERSIVEKRQQFETAESVNSQLAAVDDVRSDGIDAVAARMEDLLPRLSRIGTLVEQIEKWKRQRRDALKSLPHWSGDWSDFAAVKLPDFDVVKSDAETFEAAWKQREEARKSLEKARTSLAEKQAIFENRLRQFRIPSPDELTTVRNQRDRYWSEIRSRWLGVTPEPAETSKSGLEDPGLADVFETEIRRADEISDILRQHLETVDLSWQCREIENLLPVLEGSLETYDTACSDARRVWSAHFHFLPTVPQRPDEMRNWPTTVKSIRDLTEEIESAQTEVDRIRHDWQECRDELVLPLLPELTPAEATFEHCRRKFKSLRDSLIDTIAKRGQIEGQIRALRIDIEKKSKELDAARAAREEIAAQWKQGLADAGLPPLLEPETFETFVTELTAARKEIARYEADRIEFEADLTMLADFEAKVTALAQRIRFADPEIDPVRLAESIKRSLDEQRVRHDRRRNAQQTLDAVRKRQADARARLQDAEKNLAEIIERIGAASLDDASDRFDAIREKNELQSEIDKKLVTIKAQAQDEPLEEWIHEVRDLEPERSRTLRDEFEAGIAEDKKQLTNLWNDRFGIQTELDRINKGVDSSEVLLVEEKRKIFFETTSANMARYLKCMLVSRVLKDAAEEYRRRMGEQVIGLASTNFRILTAESFEGVTTVSDDDAGRRLVAVRANEDRTQLDLDQLSEGTQDQLFLALKIAMIQNRMIERASKGLEPLPVIFDDILVQFDDNRAWAAFALLAELAKSTQVIYLTHHRHLESIARSALGEGNFAVHRIERNGERRDKSSQSDDVFHGRASDSASLRFLENAP